MLSTYSSKSQSLALSAKSKEITFLTTALSMLVIGLICIGLIFIYSSSSVFAFERHGMPHFFVKKQIQGLIIGLIALLLGRFIPLNFIKKHIAFFFFCSLVLTAATLIPGIGVSIHGSRRWLSLGGFSFQPSELLKISCILYCAYQAAKKRYSLRSFYHGYLPFLCILGTVAAVLLKQPDFGQTVTLCLTSFFLLFVAQISTRHLVYTGVPVAPLLGMLVYFKPYRLKRILVFLNPWKDPQGSGFQIIQSLIAIGSGGLWGVGIGHSKQKFFYLPMQHTDFIFSIIAEETGLIGSLVLLSLYILFLYWGLKLAILLKDAPFCSYAIAGFVLLTVLQAAINIGVAVNLLPTKGLGLPFISYGNSALVCNLAMFGVLLNCAYAGSRETAMQF